MQGKSNRARLAKRPKKLEDYDLFTQSKKRALDPKDLRLEEKTGGVELLFLQTGVQGASELMRYKIWEEEKMRSLSRRAKRSRSAAQPALNGGDGGRGVRTLPHS